MDHAMTSLIAASLAFVGLHFALSHPLRAPLVRMLGELGFRGLYSLVALACFVWMIMAFRAVGPGGAPLWDGMGSVIWAIATVITLIASVLLIGSFIRNPALPDPKAAAHAAQRAHGVFPRHPPPDDVELHPMGAGAYSGQPDAAPDRAGRGHHFPRAGRVAYAGSQESGSDGQCLGGVARTNQLLAQAGRIGAGRCSAVDRWYRPVARGDLRPYPCQWDGRRAVALAWLAPV